MYYTNQISMPEQYVDMRKNEMQECNGGWCVEVHPWGYNVYLTHKERILLTDGQTVAGLVAGLASCGVGAAVVAAVATIIWNHDDGYGVRIRMTGLVNPVCTGVFTNSKSVEKNKAKKNAVIF